MVIMGTQDPDFPSQQTDLTAQSILRFLKGVGSAVVDKETAR
jgi:hypothetical protein